MDRINESSSLLRIRLIIIIPAIFLILAIILTAVLIALPYLEKEGEATEPEIVYSVREHEGKIGVWYSDGRLRMILDVPFSSLPESDRKEISEGITVFSEEELMALVEDYSG